MDKVAVGVFALTLAAVGMALYLAVTNDKVVAELVWAAFVPFRG